MQQAKPKAGNAEASGVVLRPLENNNKSAGGGPFTAEGKRKRDVGSAERYGKQPVQGTTTSRGERRLPGSKENRESPGLVR